jgi:S1-C subfamily serine protease
MGKRHLIGTRGMIALLFLGSAFVGIASRSPTPLATNQAYGGEPVMASDQEAAPDTIELAGLQDKFETVSRKVAGSVVSISAACSPVDNTEAMRAQDLNPEKLQTILDRTTRMVGTGFVVDSEGYILTNEHVVGDADAVWITTDDRKVYPAVVVGSDPRSDLAMLKTTARNLPAVQFAPYESIKRGQWSIALGNPYGLATEGAEAMSVGIISALDRSLPKLSRKENRLYSNLIQTTAQINPGNSGGPLFDLNGQVIGINTAVILPEKKTNGIGFAIPITPQLIQTVHDLEAGREVVYSYLGVMVSTPTESERRLASVTEPIGVRVDGLEADSPASVSGVIKENDVIVQLNGEIIRDSDQFVRIVGCCSVDKPVHLSLYRQGKVMDIQVQLRRRQLASAAITRENRRLRWQGMLLGPIPVGWTPPAEQKDHPATGVMVIGISDNSPFCKQNIHQGDVITAVAGRQIADVLELQRVLNEAPTGKICQVNVCGRTKSVAVTDADIGQ